MSDTTTKPSAKPSGTHTHAFVFSGHFYANVLPEGGRTAAYVHRYVKHRALHHEHQLVLGLLDLVVQAAQHIFGRSTVVVLDKIHATPDEISELAAFETFKKEAPLVAEHFGFDDENVGYGGVYHMHE